MNNEFSIKVLNAKHSKELQLQAFYAGYTWANGETTPMYLDWPFDKDYYINFWPKEKHMTHGTIVGHVLYSFPGHLPDEDPIYEL